MGASRVDAGRDALVIVATILTTSATKLFSSEEERIDAYKVTSTNLVAETVPENCGPKPRPAVCLPWPRLG